LDGLCSLFRRQRTFELLQIVIRVLAPAHSQTLETGSRDIPSLADVFAGPALHSTALRGPHIITEPRTFAEHRAEIGQIGIQANGKPVTVRNGLP
jgi:hypothetical protein